MNANKTWMSISISQGKEKALYLECRNSRGVVVKEKWCIKLCRIQRQKGPCTYLEKDGNSRRKPVLPSQKGSRAGSRAYYNRTIRRGQCVGSREKSERRLLCGIWI